MKNKQGDEEEELSSLLSTSTSVEEVTNNDARQLRNEIKKLHRLVLLFSSLTVLCLIHELFCSFQAPADATAPISPSIGNTGGFASDANTSISSISDNEAKHTQVIEVEVAPPTAAPFSEPTPVPTSGPTVTLTTAVGNVCLEEPATTPEAKARQRHRCLVEGRFGGAGAWIPREQANNISQSAGRPGNQDWIGDNGWAWGHPECPACALDSSFGKPEFCSVMAKLDIRSLFVVGDSLQASLCNTLGGILNARLWSATAPITAKITCSDVDGHEPFDIAFEWRRNDYLTTQRIDRDGCRTPSGQRRLKSNSCHYWMDVFNATVASLEKDKRMLLFLNTGAHVHNPEDFETNMIRIADWVQHEFLDKKRGIALWRNTPPGHHDCAKYSEPVSIAEYEATFGSDEWNLKFENEADFSWRFFRRYNEISDEVIKSHAPCMRTVDVASGSRLRPDHHKGKEDCLHYSETGGHFGPTMEWNRLFYTHLATMAESGSEDECFK